VQHRVLLDLGREAGQLGLGRQLALQEQPGDLEEARLLRQLLDRVAAVAQDARVAVDVGDGALAGAGVAVARVEGHEPGRAAQLGEVDARFLLAAAMYGELDALALELDLDVLLELLAHRLRGHGCR
jgi:hypothetical protein